MKGTRQILLAFLLATQLTALTQLPTAYAAPSGDPAGSMQEGTPVCMNALDCLPLIAQYFKRLGDNLGFSLTTPFDSAPTTSAFINYARMTEHQKNLVYTFIGALTVPTTTMGNISTLYLIDALAPTNHFVNSRTDATYAVVSAAPSTSSTPSATVSSTVQNSQLDQAPSQLDPVTQTLLNMLATPPNVDNCPKNTNEAMASPCLTQSKILANATPLPQPLTSYYQTKNNTQLVNLLTALNANTLLTPLLMTTEAPANAGQSATNGVSVQQASQFVRYVSGTIVPPQLPDFITINQKYTKENAPIIQTYLANYQTYLSQISVGISNLYYLLSKRLPQPDANNQQTSQALNEYKMGTWRLFESAQNEQNPPQETWMEKMKTASPATIQREMVILLAEINYQLYLTRQQQDRLLATNSVLLLSVAKPAQAISPLTPNDLTNPQPGSSSSSTTKPVILPTNVLP